MSINKIVQSTFSLALLFLPLVLLAADCPDGKVCIDDPLNIGPGGAFELYGRLGKAFVAIVGAPALFFFVYGGLLWMTSAGSEERIKKGKTTILWAAIGLATILGSYFILSFITTAITTPTGVPGQ